MGTQWDFVVSFASVPNFSEELSHRNAHLEITEGFCVKWYVYHVYSVDVGVVVCVCVYMCMCECA